MKITLYRDLRYDNATIGQLYIDEMFCCHTLEPRAIDWKTEKKVWGQTAIPSGTYKVILSPSSKYKAFMPYLVNVPQFTGVMLHPGNFVKDTKGCILVGWQYWQGVIGVYDSKKTFAILLDMLQYAECVSDPITISVLDRKPSAEELIIHPRFEKLYNNFTLVRYGKKSRVNAE